LKIEKLANLKIFVSDLAASKKNKCLLFDQELSLWQFSVRSEKFGLENVPLSISSCSFNHKKDNLSNISEYLKLIDQTLSLGTN
jgi:hypothetical protein